MRGGERKGDRSTGRFGLLRALGKSRCAPSASCVNAATAHDASRTRANGSLPREGTQLVFLCEAIGRDEGAESARVLSDLIRALYLDETTFHFGRLDVLGPKACAIAQALVQARLDRDRPLEYWEQAYAATGRSRGHGPDGVARQRGGVASLPTPGETAAMPSALTRPAAGARWAAWGVGLSLAAIVGVLLSWIALPQGTRDGRLPDAHLEAGRIERSGAATAARRRPSAADAPARTAASRRPSAGVVRKSGGRRASLHGGGIRAVRRRPPLVMRRRYATRRRAGVGALFGSGVVELPMTPDANTGYLPGT